MIKNLSYQSPHVAVFLRQLAWEEYVAGKIIAVKDAVEDYAQEARTELGLKKYGVRDKSGGADDFLQKRYDTDICRENGKLILCDKRWEKEWRLLYLPTHGLIRHLSIDPIVKDKSLAASTIMQLQLSLRNPAIPNLEIFIGQATAVAKACAKTRGVYFLGANAGMYIGKTDEFETRERFHGAKKSKWAVFISLAEYADFYTLDSLAASEGLLISFWNEIAKVMNDNRGNDRRPALPYLQQAILFIEGASAALLWLAREYPTSVSIPFKKWSGQADRPQCYLMAP